MVTPIQFKSAPSGYRMSCLFHPAASDSTVETAAVLGLHPQLDTSHLTICCTIRLVFSPFQI